jgi:S-adenosyl methyltransferase
MTESAAQMRRVDSSVPNVARVWNYLIGGKDNFAADREAAGQLIAAAPVMAVVGPASRAFLGRAVRHLVTEAGITQFLDVGTGLPTANNTHEVAQSIRADCRIVYVDNDPVVLSHARALLMSAPEGLVSYIDADAREPEKVIAEAGRTLDFSEPTGIVLVDLLNFIPDPDEAAGILSALIAAVAPGSHVVVMQPASDLDPELLVAQRAWNMVAPQSVTLRTQAEVASWFGDLELADPGLVTVPEWRPEPGDPSYDRPVPLYAAVARKPAQPKGTGVSPVPN